MKKEIETQIKQHQDEIKRIKAEASRLKVNSKLIELQSELLRRIIEQLDLHDITPQLETILLKPRNRLVGKDIDLASQQLLIEGRLEKLKAESDELRAQAKQEATKAQHEAWKFKKDKKDDS